MALDDRAQELSARRRSTRHAAASVAGRFGDREDQFVVLAGVVITAAVLYDVYRRYTRPGPGR